MCESFWSVCTFFSLFPRRIHQQTYREPGNNNVIFFLKGLLVRMAENFIRRINHYLAYLLTKTSALSTGWWFIEWIILSTLWTTRSRNISVILSDVTHFGFVIAQNKNNYPLIVVRLERQIVPCGVGILRLYLFVDYLKFAKENVAESYHLQSWKRNRGKYAGDRGRLVV